MKIENPITQVQKSKNLILKHNNNLDKEVKDIRE